MVHRIDRPVRNANGEGDAERACERQSPAVLEREHEAIRRLISTLVKDVTDTSLRVPPGVTGTVIGAQVFSRRGVEKDERAKALEEAEIQAKYEGYLQRQQDLVDRFEKMERTALPEDMVYTGIPGLSREVVEKLTRIQPRTLGQAGRISGITPAALSCLEIQLKKMGKI